MSGCTPHYCSLQGRETLNIRVSVLGTHGSCVRCAIRSIFHHTQPIDSALAHTALGYL